jgi:hypothetical protein
MKNPQKAGFSPNVSRETFRKLVIICVFGLFLAMINGCGEDAISEDISGFNKTIQLKTDIKSAKEVMILYNDYLPGERDSRYSIEEETLTPGRFRVTLIRSKIPDDSMEGEKLVMVVKHDGEKWKVIVVERNWRCYPGRGHTDWGIDPCG